MYDGFYRFGGVEVINVERTMRYVAAGVAPPETVIECPVGDPTGLHTALQQPEYTRPSTDFAPWYDPNRPETADFAGVLPLSVTGLDGSTRTVTFTESLADGGVPGLARREARVSAVQALLVASTTEASYAGLEWLTTALHRTCLPDADNCTGTVLEAFTTMPGPVEPTENTTAEPYDTVVPVDGTWQPWRARWDALQQAVSPVEQFRRTYGGGDATGVGPGLIDGGGAATRTPDRIIDGGTAAGDATVLPEGLVYAPLPLTCRSEVTVTAGIEPLIDAPDQRYQVRLVRTDDTGNAIEYGPLVTVTGPTTVTTTFRAVDDDDWRVGIAVAQPTHVESLVVTQRPDLSLDQCVDPLRRSYAGMTVVDGPRVVQRYDVTGCDDQMLVVEWTWTAGDPWRYGHPRPLIAGLDLVADAQPAVKRPGVTVTYEGVVTAAATACPEPVEPDTTCAFDPLRPGFVAPPRAPVVLDPAAANPSEYQRIVVALDPSVVPDSIADAVRFTFSNLGGAAKRGIRVRTWASQDFTFDTVDECSFDHEFWVDYLPPDSTLAVDGIRRQVTVICNDAVVDASAAMRGPYRSTFTFPVVGCGAADTTYYFAIDVPVSSAAGTVSLDIDTSAREG